MNTQHDDARLVTIHLTAQSTVEFTADRVWPRHGEYARFGADLDAFAEEVCRRLHTDGYVGCCEPDGGIIVIPLGAIKRIDFSETP